MSKIVDYLREQARVSQDEATSEYLRHIANMTRQYGVAVEAKRGTIIEGSARRLDCSEMKA